jgi:transcriptional regulator with XRE-family HTH domain
VRKKYTEVEKELMAKMGNNLRAILERKGIKQNELAKNTGLSTSAISDFVNAKTLMSPSNLQIIAEALDVAKGDIDPTFRDSFQIRESSPRYITGKELDELAIEELFMYNLTRKGKPLTVDQKERLVQLIQSAADLLDQ